MCNCTRLVYPPPYVCSYSGEIMQDEPMAYPDTTDIDIGRFKCNVCGEVGYYTGKWKTFWESKQ